MSELLSRFSHYGLRVYKIGDNFFRFIVNRALWTNYTIGYQISFSLPYQRLSAYSFMGLRSGASTLVTPLYLQQKVILSLFDVFHFALPLPLHYWERWWSIIPHCGSSMNASTRPLLNTETGHNSTHIQNSGPQNCNWIKKKWLHYHVGTRSINRKWSFRRRESDLVGR